MSEEVGEILWTSAEALRNLPLTPKLAYVIERAKALSIGQAGGN
jgi:hypothetical protein